MYYEANSGRNSDQAMISALQGIEESGQLHGFLKKFAIHVDKSRLERVLPAVRQHLKSRKKSRPGYSMKVLLQELDRIVDWRLAEEIEQMFFEYNRRNN